MPNHFVFADEAGCFTFKRQQGASNYFLLCTLTTADCSVSKDLLAIRRSLQMGGETERTKLHATSDAQEVRDEVYKVLKVHDFRIDATILEKCKAQPQTRRDEPTFYQYAWYYHFKNVGPRLLKHADKLMVTAAALGSKRTRAAFKLAVNNTLQQVAPRPKWGMAFMESSEDPMLWAADYCAWAVQRKWEMNDSRSHQLIADKIFSEYDLWKHGQTRYY